MLEEDEKEKVQTRTLSVRRPRGTKLSPDPSAHRSPPYLLVNTGFGVSTWLSWIS